MNVALSPVGILNFTFGCARFNRNSRRVLGIGGAMRRGAISRAIPPATLAGKIATASLHGDPYGYGKI